MREKTEREIIGIIEAFERNKYRDQLLRHSEEFLEERKRLEKIARGEGEDMSKEMRLRVI